MIILPVPQRMLSSADHAGGRYLCPYDGNRDVTDQTVSSIRIDTSTGRTIFVASKVSSEPIERKDGSLVRLNLIRSAAGWKWHVKAISIDTGVLCSVTFTGDHYYSVALEIDRAHLTRYPNARSQPRLRPTTRGVLTFGDIIGSIDLRKRIHPVYHLITITKR